MEGFCEAVAEQHTAAVCQMLKLLGCGDDMFWYVKHNDKLVPWTAEKMLGPCSDFFLRAKDVAPIEFIGGPMNDILHKGSLRTLLVDRMLQNVLKDGLIPIRKIEHILWAGVA
jgi:hypothetical protein